MGFIVILQEDGLVLLKCGVQVGAGPVLLNTQQIGLGAVGGFALGRVGVNGYEHVCSGLVGYVGTFIQLYEHIGLAGVDYLYVLAVLLNEFTHLEGHVQVYALLLVLAVYRSGVLASVTGVYYQYESALIINGTGRQ